MKIVFLMLLLFLSYVGGRLFGKLCSNFVAGGSAAGYMVYFIFNGVVSCVFFYIISGFHISLNPLTVLYSAIFALIVMLSVVGLYAYKLTDVATVTILTSTCGLVATSALGIILFQETLTLQTALRVVIILVAVILSFLDKNQKKAKIKSADKTKKTFGTVGLFVVIMALILLSNSATTIITKYYAMDPGVTDENSFFFFTNVLLILFSALILLIAGFLQREQFQKALEILKPKNALFMAGNVICSNVGSLMGILLIALIDVSVYSPVTSALTILAGVAGSLLLRERLGLLSYLAAALACVAMVI